MREFKVGHVRNFRNTVHLFCSFVDKHAGRAEEASLGREVPDLHHAVTEWIRTLPTGFKEGSRSPAWHAGRLRRMITRRAEHPNRPVAGHLPGWAQGNVGVRRGQSNELDEFTRPQKQALVKAAWANLIAIETRIKEGWTLAAAGRDPREHGWLEPANLLWALGPGGLPLDEIAGHVPAWADCPSALQALVPASVPLMGKKRFLLGSLVAKLFLHNRDLHCFRILLMAATGRAPEEVTGLFEDNVEFGPKSVTIDFTKGRAEAEPRQAFGTTAMQQGVLHPERPRLDAGDLIRRLLKLSRPLAQRAGQTRTRLFLRASVANPSTISIKPFHGTLPASSFADWVTAHQVSLNAPIDIRRLRKSGKVEKAIAFKGRISDIADDHTEETFRSHYAHGTTLRVISGDVITQAQQRWFDKAVEGPLVLSEEAVRSLDDPATGEGLGLSAQEIEDLTSGELDMGVSGCRNPRESPFGRPGQLCPVAPLRCLECRNALVLPSNLPQLLLFADHLESLRTRLQPQHFHELWGQSRVNLLAALDARSDAEIAQARTQITDEELTLQLPLSAHVEFDA